MRLVFLALFAVGSFAQPWSGILDPTRAIDWSTAGVIGGIPSSGWSTCTTSQCNTLYGGTVTKSSIEAAIASASANTVVRIPAGTFSIAGGIEWSKDSVVLRGAGASQTTLNFSSDTSCWGLAADLCIASTDQTYPGSPGTVRSWSEGYAKGTTQVTLSSTAGITANQSLLVLDQTNEASDTGNIWNCDTACASEGSSSGGYRSGRAQAQITLATAVNGNVVTIQDPIHMPNYASGRTPQAWVITPVKNTGVENITLNHTTAQPTFGVMLYSCYGCWVRGVRNIYPDAFQLALWQSPHSTIRDNYFYKTGDGTQTSNSYSIEVINTSSALVENNIFQQCLAGISVNGNGTGNVYAYNYFINSPWGFSDAMNFSTWLHSAGVAMELYEGNIGNGWVGDQIHGSHHMQTLFRNYYLGWESGRTLQTGAVGILPFSRFFNVVGNVLGMPSFTNTYKGTNLETRAVYLLEIGTPSDSLAETTLMRWGNYDVVNAAVRWQSAEVPSKLALYANAVPESQSLPSSFYLSTRPSAWWKVGDVTPPWPPIGPEVTGGPLANLGGRVYRPPAYECYTTIMSGPADGSGSVLSFDADACYAEATDEEEDTEDPVVTITSPTEDATYATAANSISLAGTASDDTGVSEVTWVNSAGGSGTATGTTSWSATIPLTAGSNVITVTAADAAENEGTDVITVTYTPRRQVL